MTETVVTKHELLQRKANIVRSRLLRTIDALDQRRHKVVDVGEDAVAIVKRAALPVGMALGGLLVVGSGIALALQRRAERARRRTLGYWIGKAFLPPPPPRPNFLLEALRKAGIAVIVSVATEIAKRQATAFAESGKLPAISG